MSDGSTESLVRRFMEARNAADWSGALACLDEEVVHDREDGRREIGQDAYRAFLAETARRFDEAAADLVVMMSADGTRAAVEYTARGTSREGATEGRRYSVPAGQFFEIDDGRIVRIAVHDLERARLEAIAQA